MRHPYGVRVEVSDGDERLPVLRHAGDEDEDENGRGLALLDAVVDKWGVDSRRQGGKTVWFEVAPAVTQVAEPADVSDDG